MLFFILVYFLPFYLPNSPKNQNLEEVIKTLEISPFYNSVPKIMIICYTVPGIWCVKDVYNYFLFWAIFCPFIYPPKSPKNQNFGKMKKTSGDIIILHMCTKNYDQKMYGSWDMLGNGLMEGQTDRQMEKVTYRGGCPT